VTIEKENFLRTRLVPLLQKLDPSLTPNWGKMNVQQMIEHYTSDGVCIASGRAQVIEIITPAERLTRYREFMMSDRPFQENTLNPLLPAEPSKPNFKTVQASIGALQEELIYFFEAFRNDPSLVTRNPIFGDLNFEENVQLLYKHAVHHLKQFGIEINY
jgi:hypothetical protein